MEIIFLDGKAITRAHYMEQFPSVAANVLASAAMLNGKQRRHLRSLGHHLKPVVLVGKEGISESLVASTDEALEQHELIKVRFGEHAGEDRHALAAALTGGCKAELAGVIGRTALLYRRRKKDPTIVLPK